LLSLSGLTSRTSTSPASAGALCGVDLVAHQRKQRRDDHGGTCARSTQQRRGDEVHGRLAPARALHDQRAPPLDHQRVDRGPLVVAQPRALPGEGGQHVLGP
jgi:hypothetical protein